MTQASPPVQPAVPPAVPPAVHGKYYPFRTQAVEAYERPTVSTVPTIVPYWRYWPVVVSVCLVVAASAILWR